MDLSQRIAWRELIADVTEGKFDAVLVTKPDRISRSIQDIRDILHAQEDIKLVFIS